MSNGREKNNLGKSKVFFGDFLMYIFSLKNHMESIKIHTKKESIKLLIFLNTKGFFEVVKNLNLISLDCVALFKIFLIR